VKPGVTGIWQVEARDLANFDLYRRYDLLYVQNWSLALDLTIITRTVAVVALRTLRSLVPARAGAAAATLE
jgi:lipopolysaccharide/colanic/teichoic acid biosynthesis glycosyltransferase